MSSVSNNGKSSRVSGRSNGVNNTKLFPFVVIVLLALLANADAARVVTLADVVTKQGASPANNVQFPGAGQVLGGAGEATRHTTASAAAGHAALAREAARTTASMCTRSGSCYTPAAEVAMPAVTATPMPIGPIIGATALVMDVAHVHQEKGGKAAVVKAIGGGATLAAAAAAGKSCALMGAVGGPIASFAAGVACSAVVSFAGNAGTDKVIDNAVDEAWVVESTYHPKEGALERCEYLIQRIEARLKANEGDEVNTRLRSAVEEILGTNGNENSLIPDECQYVALSVAQQLLGMVEFTNLQWLEMLGDGSVLFAGCSNEETRREDLNARAREIVGNMVSRGIFNIRTMDGHGRFVFYLLKVIHERGLDVNDYTIDLYDMNHDSNAWHVWFMPAGVMVLDENILRSNDEIDTDTGLADSVVYYNFCGMGTQQDSVIDNIFQITNSEHGQGSQVFVSWSVRGVANKGSDAWKFAEWVSNQGKMVSRRGNFYTYMLN